MKRAYEYWRYSDDKQADGDSIRRQREWSSKYAAKKGWPLDAPIVDEAKSGYKGEHVKGGAFGRFLDDVTAGRVKAGSVLLVEDLDRVSRQQTSVALQMFLSLLNSGIDIVTRLPEPEGMYFPAG